MFTEAISKLDALRGQENIQPHELLDTIKDALGQCQAFLEQRGPVQIGINGSGYEARGQAGYKLPQKRYTGAANQNDVSGYGSDYSFLPMFNPTIGSTVNGFKHPTYGYPLMFADPATGQWNWQDVFAPLIVRNDLSFWQMPDAWALGIDARGGAVHNALNGFFQGVNVFAPANIDNNHFAGDNHVAIVNHGDTITRKMYISLDLFVNRDVFIDGDVDVNGDMTVLNLTVEGDLDLSTATIDLTGLAGYNGANDQVLMHEAGVLTWKDVEEC